MNLKWRKWIFLVVIGLVPILAGCNGCDKKKHVAPPPAPSAPSNLSGSAVSSTEINLAWQDNSTNEKGFNVYRKTTDNYSKVAIMEANATSYSNSGLNPETTYYYKVTAYNDGGESDSSDEVNVTTLAGPGPPPVPSPPSNLVGIAVSLTQIDLSWEDNSTNEKGFYVYRKTAGDYGRIASLGMNVMSYSDGGVNQGTIYWYKVTAYNEGGESGSSNEWRVTLSDPLQPPSNMTATAVSYKYIQVSWQDNSVNEDGFQVYCRPGEDISRIIATLGPNSTVYGHDSLQPMTEHEYFVCAYREENSREGAACSEKAHATTPCPVRIVESELVQLGPRYYKIAGQLKSYAHEPCCGDITGNFYLPNGKLIRTVRARFVIREAQGTADFGVEWIRSVEHSDFKDDYDVEITSVEIEY